MLFCAQSSLPFHLRNALQRIRKLNALFLAEVICMSVATDELLAKIKQLSDEEQLRLVDAVLTNLDTSEPQIARVWADEARRRWTAYKAGKIPTVSYEEVMAKHKR